MVSFLKLTSVGANLRVRLLGVKLFCYGVTSSLDYPLKKGKGGTFKLEQKSLMSESVIIHLAILSLLWLSLLYFGTQTASTQLDASWTQALGYAFKHHYQAGVDYIYTYGPLGYFYHAFSSYDTDLFYYFIAWHIIAGFVLSAFFLAISSKIDGKIDKFIYFSLLIFVISSFPPEAPYFLGITAVVILAITMLSGIKQLSQMTLFLIMLLFLAVVSLTKFSNFVLVGVGIVAITVMAWHIYSISRAITIPVVFAIFLIITWLISGQFLSNLPLFIVNSLDIASGYSEAMSLQFTPTEIKLALACFGIMTLMIIIGNFTKPWKLESLVIAGVVMLALFLAWKSGFVRQGLHERLFFTFALIVPFFLDYNRKMNVGLLLIYRVLRYLAIFTALIGLFVVVGTHLNFHPHNFLSHWNSRIVQNITTLAHLPQFQAGMDKELVRLKQQYDLPKIRAQVGQSTVDIFSWEQGIVFLNELNWHPRPIFQSYVAYTPSLITINGEFYGSEQAPQFVLFKLQAIDLQFPLLNDNEALKILFRDYQPVLSEKGYLLLKRSPRGQGVVSDGKNLLTQEMKIGEQVDIRPWSHKPLLLSLDIRKSFLGRLYSLLYRFPEIYLEIGTTEGRKMSYRIIPKMTKSGFVINPLILTQADMKKWYKNQPLKQVATLRVVIKPDWLQYLFKNTIEFSVSEFEVTPYPIDERVKQEI
ncbi:MAG: hypothetical protein DRR16_00070 [Candidatus Parabeggiatoa sp. nov. 3]|nr:MAG: hypothetical protein DRR00_05830 [Gammaproteobacteria bacterium]RKZ69613.1 MAG: hypothetical protein DRQ99_00490 [Gammaproteobacteria bacterium]RKZ90268.1 MAG: hypothetical protein DRR16_00070 [Gammaproteobacteria bacterium]